MKVIKLLPVFLRIRVTLILKEEIREIIGHGEKIMLKMQLGLTKMYNQQHNPDP
jgi:hypothetical protein